MKFNKLTTYVHALLTSLVDHDDIIIDMTLGNGYDTLFLSKIAKHVYSFDIQQLAIDNSMKKLKDKNNVTIIKDSFINVLNYVSNFKGVIYNLGYLPGSDKKITTNKYDLIKSLNTLLPLLHNDMFIIITVYPGHEEGNLEHQALNLYIDNLSTNYGVLKTESKRADESAPYVLYFFKK